MSSLTASTRVGDAFVESFADADFERIESLLAPDVAFRKLTPGGYAEATTVEGALEWFRNWRADVEDAELLAARVEPIGGKIQIEYTVRGVEDGMLQVFRQTAYATIEDGRIAAMDVLCSGSHPVP